MKTSQLRAGFCSVKHKGRVKSLSQFMPNVTCQQRHMWETRKPISKLPAPWWCSSCARRRTQRSQHHNDGLNALREHTSIFRPSSWIVDHPSRCTDLESRRLLKCVNDITLEARGGSDVLLFHQTVLLHTTAISHFFLIVDPSIYLALPQTNFPKKQPRAELASAMQEQISYCFHCT